MEAIYPYLLILHIFCAIIFVGYLFLDVVLSNDLDSALKPIARFLPLSFLLLLLSGGAMISQHINSDIGFFATHTQQFLVIKALIALVLASLVVFSLFYAYVLKKPSPLRKVIHPIALSASVVIIIMAKLAFF